MLGHCSNISYRLTFSGSAREKAVKAGYMVDVLMNCMPNQGEKGKETICPVSLEEPGEPLVASVPLSQAR